MMTRKHLSLLLFALFSLLFFAAAGAQSFGDLPGIDEMQRAALGPPKDESMRLLSGIFGEVATDHFKNAGPATTLFGHVVFLFNGAVFIIGAGILVWQSVMLIAVSANDGEPLSKQSRVDGVLTPIKIGIGIFGMLPAFGGFSLAQVFMIIMITLGTGLGNMLAQQVIERSASMQSLMPSVAAIEGTGAHSSGIEKLGKNLLIVNACSIAQELKARAHYSENGQLQLLPENQANFHRWTLFEDNQRRGDSTRGIDFGSCGRIAIAIPKESELRLNEGAQSILGFRSAAVDYRAIVAAVESAAYNEMIDLNIDIRNLIQSWMLKYWGSNASENDIYTLIAEYDELIRTSKRRLNHSISNTYRADRSAIDGDVMENMKAGGWVGLGNWNSVFSEIGASLASAQSAYSYSFVPGAQLQRVAVGNTGEFYSVENLSAMLIKHLDNHQDAGQINEFGECYFESSQTPTGECSIGQNIGGMITSMIAEDSGGTGLVNPVTASKNLGDYLMSVGQGMLAVGFGAKATHQVVSGALSGIPVIGGLLSGISEATVGNVASISTQTGWIMTATGAYLSVFIPMLFFMAWFAAILTWIVTMFEAVLMAQIGAFSHVTIRDQGLMDGPSRKVYNYALYALFAPALLVISWIVAQAVSVYAGTLLFKWFTPAFSAAQGNSITGIITLVAVTFIFCAMLFGLISTCANIFQLPRKLLGYLGENEGNNLMGAAIVGASTGAMMSQARMPGVGGSRSGAKPTTTSGGGGTGFTARTR